MMDHDGSFCDESSRAVVIITRQRLEITVWFSTIIEMFTEACGARDSIMPSPSPYPCRILVLASQQQISIIMSVNGVIQNVKWTDLMLTANKEGTYVKVDGNNFTDTDNQRWVGHPTYDSATDSYLTSIQNKESGHFLARDESFKVVMSKSPYSWKLVVLKGQVAFQVPHVEGGSAKGFHTLQLEADKSVILKYVDWLPTSDEQLWTIVSK